MSAVAAACARCAGSGRIVVQQVRGGTLVAHTRACPKCGSRPSGPKSGRGGPAWCAACRGMGYAPPGADGAADLCRACDGTCVAYPALRAVIAAADDLCALDAVGDSDDGPVLGPPARCPWCGADGTDGHVEGCQLLALRRAIFALRARS